MHVLDLFNESDRNFLNGVTGPVTEADVGAQNFEAWKQQVQAAYPQQAGRIMFVSKDNGNVVSAEIPGMDRSFGVFDMDTEQGQVLDEEKAGLWSNIHNKRKRIKSGSGERMRAPGSKGAPTAQNFKDAAVREAGSIQDSWNRDPEQEKMDATRRGRLGRERNAGLDEPDDVSSSPAPTRNGVYEYTVPAGQEGIAQELGLQQHRGHWVSRIPIQRANFQFGRPHFHEIPAKGVEEGQLGNPGEPDSPVAQAIVRRILMQRTDLLAKHGPDKVSAAVDEVADFVGDVDEIGSSDVSGWIRYVEQMLGNMDQGVAEGSEELYGLKVGDTVKATVRGVKVQGDVIDIFPETEQVELLLRGANAGRTITVDVRDTEALSEQGVAEATGDKSFDNMMKTIKKGTAKQATADRREQRKQSQQQARDAFGPNPAANLGIRKPPVSEGDTEQKPRIRKYTKMRPDGSKAIRYEVLDYMGRRANGQGSEGFDDLKNAKQFYYRNRVNLVAPVDEEYHGPNGKVDIDRSVAGRTTVRRTDWPGYKLGRGSSSSMEPALYKDDKHSTAGSAYDDEENLPFDDYDDTKPIGMKESSRYWCKEEKRWKDNK